jgi:hypothetical protein
MVRRVKPLVNVFLGFAFLFGICGIVLFAWSGCDDVSKPRIYRGPNIPEDVVLFGHAYRPDTIPLHVRLVHGYGWIPLLLLAYGSFKVAERLDSPS